MGVHHHTGDTAGGQNYKTAEVRKQSHEEGRTYRAGVAGKQVGEGTGNSGEGQEAEQVAGTRGGERTQTGAALSEDGQASETNQQVQRHGGGGTLAAEHLSGDVNAEGLEGEGDSDAAQADGGHDGERGDEASEHCDEGEVGGKGGLCRYVTARCLGCLRCLG